MRMVSKTQLVPEIWRLFYDRLKAQVTSCSITGSKTITIANYDANFSDPAFEDKTYYPVIVVNTPSVPTDRFTSGKDIVEGSITIDIYTNQSESADKFISQIQNAIETYRGTLANNGLRQIKFGSINSDMVLRGTIKIHLRSLPITFKNYYNRTIAY